MRKSQKSAKTIDRRMPAKSMTPYKQHVLALAFQAETEANRLARLMDTDLTLAARTHHYQQAIEQTLIHLEYLELAGKQQ